jgi:hypothetical protein
LVQNIVEAYRMRQEAGAQAKKREAS